MKKVLIGFGILIALLIAALLIVPSLIPAEVYKSKIEETLSAKLGRDVDIAGDIGISVFPTLKARAGEVTIANGETFGDAPLASMTSLEAGIKLIPLISKKIEITKFNLVDAKVNLIKAKDGRVNWTFGDSDAAKEVKEDAGPFKRDGRYSDLQVSLGKFALTNAAISYVDHQKQTKQDLANVNMKLSLPGMDKPIALNGDLVYNGTPLSLVLDLDTPKRFLQGEKTPVKIKLVSELLNISADGHFTESETITFDTKFDGDIPSVSALDKAFGIKNPYAALAQSAKLSGMLAFDGETLRGKRVDAKLASAIIKNDFKGDFVLGKTPSAAGDLNTNILDLQALLSTLNMEIPQAGAVKTIDLSAALSNNGAVTTAKNIKLNLKGDQLLAAYTGAANYGETLELDGQLTAASPSLTGLMGDLGLDVPAQAGVLGDLIFDADVKGTPEDLKLSSASIKTNGQQLNANFTGDLGIGKTITVNGHAFANSPSVPALVTALGIENAQANALGDLEIRANISGAADNLSIKDVELLTQGEYVTANYKGDISAGETQSLDGTFDLTIPSMSALSTAAGMTIPNAKALGKFAASGNVNGPTDALAITALKARATDGMLNAGFEGNAKLGKALSYSGNLDASIPSLRALAKLTGVELTPSSKAGQIYEHFSISGTANGSATHADFNNANIKFDDLQSTGEFKANFTGKPVFTGSLALAGLDLRPYMAAMAEQNPTGKIEPWSEEPINFAALNLFDANIKATTPNIITDRMEIDQSTISMTVKDGLMKANMPNMILYGGQGNMDVSLNAKPAVPQLAMDFTLDNVDGKSFLGAAAGFTQLTGNTGTHMKITGAGRSQAELMRSLSGSGDFELSKGVLAGIDVNKFASNISTSSLQNMASTRTLPEGIGASYNTPFDQIDGLFTIKNGIVTIGDFELSAANVMADGGGSLDLGNQTIDFSFHPRLKNGKGLAAFGVPLQFKGGFGSVKAGIDTTLLTKIITARAKQEVTKTVTDQIGGTAGDVVGSILGGGGSQSTSGTSSEEAIGGLIGDVLGKPKSETTQTTDTKKEEEKKKPEDDIENALKGLFGKKK